MPDNGAADVGGADRYGLLRINCGGGGIWQRHQAGKHRQPRTRFGYEHGPPPGIEPALWPAYRRRHFSKTVGSGQWLESAILLTSAYGTVDARGSSDVRFAPQAVFKARMRSLDEKAVILTSMVESQLSA
jgi:hypothetical protein